MKKYEGSLVYKEASFLNRLFLCLFFALSLLFMGFVQSSLADVIVDNGDVPGTVSSGTWSTSSGANPYGGSSLYARPGATYTWSFDSQPAGDYEVLMWWTVHSTRGSNIQVEIHHVGGTDPVYADQTANGGEWNSLGTFSFDGTGSVTITASDEIASDGRTVTTCADAVWLRSLNEPPTAVIEDISPNPAESGALVTFAGSGTDPEGDAIAGYWWESDLTTPPLSQLATFSTDTLPDGTHMITFQVMDDAGFWSEPAQAILTVGDQPVDVVVDNNDSNADSTGTWRTSSGADPNGDDSVYARPEATFTWAANSLPAGDYEISMWWTEHTTRGTNIQVEINHSGVADTFYVNQQTNGGQWNSLGTFYFDGTGNVTITASNEVASDGRYVTTCADAVRFVLSEPAITYTITATAGANGAISPAGAVTVNEADDQTFDIVPDSGYRVADVLVDGVSVGAVTSYTFDDVYANHTIDASFEASPTYTITAMAGANGAISPTGVVTVKEADDQTFDIVPDTGYRVADVLVDGVSVGAVTSYTFHDVYADHTIDASFEAVPTYTIAAMAGANGAISPTGAVTVNEGDDQTFDIVPDTGYQVADVLVDDVSVGAVTSYTFDDVYADHTIEASFEVAVVPTEFIIDNGDLGTSSSGTWMTSSGPYPYGNSSLYARPDATYTWNFSSLPADYYEVFICWTEHTTRGTNIQMDIIHFDGTDTIYVNQTINGGAWNSLGIFFFEGGGSVTITASSELASDGRYVTTCADAVRLVATEDPATIPPTANYYADRTFGVENSTIQFYDQSTGTIGSWFWDFGDGETSTARNPSHEYTLEGDYTVSLTVTNSAGSDTMTKDNYIQIASAVENIYLCGGYSSDGLFIPWCETQLRNLGATEHNGVWQYTNPNKGITYFIRDASSVQEMLAALREPGAHIIYNGHSNYGLGPLFATTGETGQQKVYGVRYVDDPRFLNLSTDMLSIKIDGMVSGQAYPDWTPFYSNGESALMPYDFNEGMPPYNYYIFYSVPGDPTVYNMELPDGSFVERFPDSRKPAWDFSVNPFPPDPVDNPEYFITNPGDEFNHTEFVGEWTAEGDCYGDDSDCLGYNYHYSSPGSGADIATYYFVVGAAGNYAVEASWESSPSNATNAKYTIFHSGGATTVEADQTASTGGGLVFLGEFYFDVGYHTVELSDEADGTVIADAVHLAPVDNPDDVIKSEFRAGTAVSGDAPLTVEFDSRAYASEEIIEWRFDFGDSSSPLVLSELPGWGDPPITHTYSSPGIYDVTLRVTDALGRWDEESKENFVVVGMDTPLHAEFTQTSRFAELGTTVSFYDQSSGEITDWEWNFGDGSYLSYDQNPRHVYETPGVYTVSLTVSGPGGSDTEIEYDYIYTISETSYTDNSYQYKSHFVSRGGETSTFGKVVLDMSSVTVPEEEFRYSRLFYASCSSVNYFAGKLGRGTMFFTTAGQSSYNAHHYLRNYLLGWSDDEILADLNSRLDVYGYYDFDQIPPSMR